MNTGTILSLAAAVFSIQEAPYGTKEIHKVGKNRTKNKLQKASRKINRK